MAAVTSFRATDVQPDELAAIMADYLRLDQARVFRRLALRRFMVLALIAGGVSALLLSASVFWFSIALCAAVPTVAWIGELRIERRLARRLDHVPTQTTDLSSATGQRF